MFASFVCFFLLSWLSLLLTLYCASTLATFSTSFACFSFFSSVLPALSDILLLIFVVYYKSFYVYLVLSSGAIANISQYINETVLSIMYSKTCLIILLNLLFCFDPTLTCYSVLASALVTSSVLIASYFFSTSTLRTASCLSPSLVFNLTFATSIVPTVVVSLSLWYQFIHSINVALSTSASTKLLLINTIFFPNLIHFLFWVYLLTVLQSCTKCPCLLQKLYVLLHFWSDFADLTDLTVFTRPALHFDCIAMVCFASLNWACNCSSFLRTFLYSLSYFITSFSCSFVTVWTAPECIVPAARTQSACMTTLANLNKSSASWLTYSISSCHIRFVLSSPVIPLQNSWFTSQSVILFCSFKHCTHTWNSWQ